MPSFWGSPFLWSDYPSYNATLGQGKKGEGETSYLAPPLRLLRDPPPRYQSVPPQPDPPKKSPNSTLPFWAHSFGELDPIWVSSLLRHAFYPSLGHFFGLPSKMGNGVEKSLFKELFSGSLFLMGDGRFWKCMSQLMSHFHPSPYCPSRCPLSRNWLSCLTQSSLHGTK